MTSGTWLVVAPAAHAEDERVAGAVRLLESLGATAAGVALDDTDADRDLLAGGLRTVLDSPVGGVLSLLSLDETHGLALSTALVQALGDAGVEAPLWCLTSGAVRTGTADAVPAPGAAQVWALGQVAAQEYPHRWGGLLDLPAAPTAADWRRVGAVLTGGGREEEVAVRAAGVLARRLVRAPLGDAGKSSAPDGLVLTGGGREDDAGAPWMPEGQVLLTGAVSESVEDWLVGLGVEPTRDVTAGARTVVHLVTPSSPAPLDTLTCGRVRSGRAGAGRRSA